MGTMIVRCGNCRIELEVGGPGEFVCPSCGTRNVVRGDSGLEIPDLGAAAPPEANPSVRWINCPSCSYRFAVGEVSEVTCPSCGTKLEVLQEGVRVAPGQTD